MNVSASRSLLRSLALAAGPSGAEGEVRTIVRDTLAESGEISYDALGSIVCEKAGAVGTPRVVLDSHLDEVGFMVQSIDNRGRLRFVPLGGWWGHVLLAQRVDVMTDRRLVPGVIASKPPHFLAKAERGKVMELDAMHIDIGASSRAEAERFGVRVGDPVVPHSDFVEMSDPDILSCKAFDNRVGVGVMCETMQALHGVDHPNTVIAVGAVQEEVGCRGATTSSRISRPDVGIVLEGTPADDMPGFQDPQAILGNGPQIRFFDPTSIANRKLVRFVERVAAECDIPVQLAVRRSGGTDARSIALDGRGVPTVVIGVPARYIHTHVSIIHWDDYAGACNLVTQLVKQLNEEAVGELSNWD